jgi:hypothetical protein
MSGAEWHASLADDWRVYGHNLAEESAHMGGQFLDARRLMLCAWEGWTSGEPDPREVLHELLATLWAMTMSSGIDDLEVPLEALAAEMAAKVPQ